MRRLNRGRLDSGSKRNYRKLNFAEGSSLTGSLLLYVVIFRGFHKKAFYDKMKDISV